MYRKPSDTDRVALVNSKHYVMEYIISKLAESALTFKNLPKSCLLLKLFYLAYQRKTNRETFPVENSCLYVRHFLFAIQWESAGCGRKTWRFISPVSLATVWGGVMRPRSVASWFHAISVAMEQWTSQHGAFVVEAYFKNGGSAVTTQRLFRRHFNIPRHGRVSCRNTIKEWVQNFRENASALKRKPRGRIPSARTPENVDKVRILK